jgi:hypothetical protein
MPYIQATAHTSNPYTTTYMIQECTKEMRNNSYHSNTSIAAATLSQSKNQPIP